MKFKYKLENENFYVTFCSDNLGNKPVKKKKSYLQISKNLKELKSKLNSSFKTLNIE